MDRVQKKNTIAFEFGKNGVMPSLKDAISFVAKDLKIKDTDVHSVYRDPSENTFFVKFTDEEVVKEVTQNLRSSETFKYSDGTTAQVFVASADGFFRYVRIFNLPPEVDDAGIVKAMTKFGTVRQVVREKLPVDLDFDAYSGTRGVHMEVKAEIPPAVYIGHFKCRIFYEGLRNRCFLCKEEGHVKAKCPKRSSVQSRIDDHQKRSDDTQPRSFADVVDGITPKPVSEESNPSGTQNKVEELPPSWEMNVEQGKSSGKSEHFAKRFEEMDISPMRTPETGGTGVNTNPPRISRSMEMRRHKRGNGDSKDHPVNEQLLGKAAKESLSQASKKSRSSSVKGNRRAKS